MKNIKNILGMGAFMLLSSWAVSSCTEKSDWDIDPSYSRPFGTDENGISVETDDRVARAVVSWSSTQNTDYYLIEVSPNEMTEDTPMGSEENESLVFGNDPANRITRSPFTMEGLAVNTTYYLRIKSISGEKESRWVNAKKTFESVKEETILNIPSVEDLPEGEGKVRMTWEAGLAVDYFEIVETGATEATRRDISATEAAVGEAWIENLKTFTEYTITVYNGNTPRGSQTVTIPGLEIESTITDITDNSAVFAWETTVDVNEYACVLSTEGVPESGTKLSAEEIAAHKVTITGLNSSTEYTAYAFANGSICSRITFTTKKGKPVGYTEYELGDELDWANLRGKVLINIRNNATITLPSNSIPADIEEIVFWGNETKPSVEINNIDFAGQTKKIEFYNLDIYSTNKGGNFVIYLDNQSKTVPGSIEKIAISSCMIRDFRGVVRVRKTTSNANTLIEIDDCIIKGLQGGHYGILHASDITGSSGAGSLASLKLDLTNSTIANFSGSASSIVRTANSQRNVTTNIEYCTFYGFTASGEQLMRDITGSATTLNVSKTLFAASNTNYKVFNSASVAPSNISWQNVYVSSDFKFTNTNASIQYKTMTLSSSELFSCTDSDSEFTLSYGENVTEEYKAIGDPRWNK